MMVHPEPVLVLRGDILPDKGKPLTFDFLDPGILDQVKSYYVN